MRIIVYQGVNWGPIVKNSLLKREGSREIPQAHRNFQLGSFPRISLTWPLHTRSLAIPSEILSSEPQHVTVWGLGFGFS